MPFCIGDYALKPLTVICGHYGVGKTNFTLNVALDAAKAGYCVTVVDLDIVNPYFRSSDYLELLEEHGIEVVKPVLARTSVDVPSLPPAVMGAIESSLTNDDTAQRLVLLDVGGDDVGAVALSRFRALIDAVPYTMLYVINRFRSLDGSLEEAMQTLREVEKSSGLTTDALVNNSHLKAETTQSDLDAGADFAVAFANMCNLPIACHTFPKTLVSQKPTGVFADLPDNTRYAIQVFVKTPWE